MAIYSPPTSNVPIFDSIMFSGNRIHPTGSVVAPSFVEFPNAQGAVAFNYTANGNELVLGENGLEITQTTVFVQPSGYVPKGRLVPQCRRRA